MNRPSMAARLGGPARRRRRHRIVGIVALSLLLVSSALILLGGDDPGERAAGPGSTLDATATTAPLDTVEGVCQSSNAELETAQRALLEGNEAPTAAEEFLGDAFVDIVRARADGVEALDAGAEVASVVAAMRAVADAIEADPATYAAATTNPFADVNAQWVDAGFPDCAIGGSDEPDVTGETSSSSTTAG